MGEIWHMTALAAVLFATLSSQRRAWPILAIAGVAYAAAVCLSWAPASDWVL